MKAIFLDIDGVLNTRIFRQKCEKLWRESNGLIKSRDIYGVLFDPNAVANLKRIIDATDAKIVISSSWRTSGIRAMVEMWDERNLPGEVIGITPILHTQERGLEIEQYLQTHVDIENYVIIDDITSFLDSQIDNLITTDPHNGICDYDVEKAIQILNN